MNVQLTDKIECIFHHTLLLIKVNGFHGTPMSQIAKHADVAVGTIYHYFPSKEKLILELYHYCKEKIHQFIFKNLDEEISYQRKFELVFIRFTEFNIQHDVIFSFMEQFYNSPYFELEACNNRDGIYEQNHFLDFLQEGINNKHLRKIDVYTLTSAFIGTSVSFSKSILNRRIEYDENNLRELVKIIWQGSKQDDEI